jgi:hypothetical protein
MAVSDFALRGGKMRLVCSPQLNSFDIQAIREAHEMRKTLSQALEREMRAMLEAPSGVPVVRLLSALLVSGAVEMRLSYPVA